MSDQGFTPPPAPNYVPNSNPQANSSMAIASLVCGILGLVGILPVVGSILGIVFGRIHQRDFPAANDQYARIGIILGWIGVGLAIAVAVLFIGFFVVFGVATMNMASIIS